MDSTTQAAVDVQTVTYDYEGPAVSYDTTYHIEAVLHSWSGEILDSSSADVRTPVRIRRTPLS